jgi:hypothetical protein
MFQFMRKESLFGAIAAIVLLTAAPAFAQGTGTIRGRVSDEQNLALPGVSVTITSPALITAQQTSVTDGEGMYSFPDIAIGVYRVTYELGGFQRLVREDVQLTAGFEATLNVMLRVGTLEESITVSGSSPVVDVTNTTPTVSLSAEALTDIIPAQRNYREFISQAPSIAAAKSDLIGGAQASPGAAYGISGQLTTMVDGVNARQGATAVGMSPDLASMEEFQVVNVAGSAEQALPGTFVNMIIKSGGNQFHGRYEVNGSGSGLVSDNLTDSLRSQGLRSDGLKYAVETTGDLGGRLIRDRLWFYGAGRWVANDRTPFGLSSAPGPDRAYNTADDVAGVLVNRMQNETAKFTYQAARAYRLVGLAAFNAYTQNPQSVSRTVPLEASAKHHNDPHQAKFEIQGTPSSRFLFDAMIGRNRYTAVNFQQPGTENMPSTRDNFTQIETGPITDLRVRPREQWQPTATVSFFPLSSFLGRHELKGGFQYSYQYQGTGQLAVPHGSYRLIFDTIGGVAHQPFQIITYNYPIHPRNYMAEGGGFVQDTWRMGERTTVNLGLRFDSFRTWVPEQIKAQGQFGNAGTIPRFDTGTWREWAPRLGVSYNLSGDGKTVVKATWGKYNHTPGDDFSAAYNPNTEIATTYRWRDLNNNGDYDAGEVNLSTTGTDFVTITGASNNIFNPDLKNPYTIQSTLGLERELANNFGARFLYVYVKQHQLFDSNGVNVLRPYSAWDRPIATRDPGPDGVTGNADDGPAMTIYDYDPAYRGGTFVGNKRLNRPDDRAPVSQTFEAVLNRRSSARWGLSASASATKTHNWSVPIPSSPNDEINNEFEYWEKQLKLTGNYNLPYRIALSGTFSAFSGLVGQRTFLFRGLPSASTATIRLEENGTSRGPARALLNIRFAKDIPAGGVGRVRVAMDVLNVLNNASPWTISRVSGPTYGQISSIDMPRLIRGSFVYSF